MEGAGGDDDEDSIGDEDGIRMERQMDLGIGGG